jgi:tetratricopeptide (TPR) repeat protein
MTIDELYEDIEEHWENENLSKIPSLLTQVWSLLPEPKYEQDESYHVADYFVEVFLELNELDNALRWANEIYLCDTSRIDSGERDFLKGRVYFKMGHMEDAKRCFEVANSKSEGSCFEDEDDSYKNLLDKSEIRPSSLEELLERAIKEIKLKNFRYSLSLLFDSLNFQMDNPTIHFYKGLCHFELNELNHAADSFTRAYMIEGEYIFKDENPKYLEFLKTRIEMK